MDCLTEIIFVGLPGPTHHYGGLSADNVASNLNRGCLSNPKEAALQALALARLLGKLGVQAAILPPQLRPDLGLLRLHFSGSDEAVITQAGRDAQALLEQASSASAMWTANAATVAPVNDCTDHKLHMTVANLFTNMHRRIEAEATYHVLKQIFADIPETLVHAPLSAAAGLRDEGAANHMRLAPGAAARGLNVFVYGTDGGAHDLESARQSLSASRAIKAQHHILDAEALFLRQNPQAIRQGVFHNDVIAVSNDNVLLVHEEAYVGGRGDITRIEDSYRALHPGKKPITITVAADELSVEEAVHTYFFNSQIVTLPGGEMAIIAPVETQLLYEGKAAALMERVRADARNPVTQIHYVDLRQSMRNGGGPACLRLRVPVNDVQLSALQSRGGVLAQEALLANIEKMIRKHYPDELSAQDLSNPKLFAMCKHVLAELGETMGLTLFPSP